MEKYTKWDDPSNGLNPFTPLETKPQFTNWKKYLRTALSVFFLLLRIPCILLSIFMLFACHAYKYIFLVPYLIRVLEKLFDSTCCKVMMNTASANSIKELYHKDDKGFDFVKSQKGELEVTHIEADVYITNQTCALDYLYLMQRYSPIFTKIVIVEKANGETKAGLRVLGPMQMITHSIGICFPDVVKEEDPSIYFSIKELKDNYGFLCYKGRRPVVIMPEGTKTNGLGILNIERDIVEMIAKACESD